MQELKMKDIEEALKASRNNFLNENQTVESRRLHLDPTKRL
jgi:hypothetical protein